MALHIGCIVGKEREKEREKAREQKREREEQKKATKKRRERTLFPSQANRILKFLMFLQIPRKGFLA